MSTGYGCEGLMQVCAMLLGARHVPERTFFLPFTNRQNERWLWLLLAKKTASSA